MDPPAARDARDIAYVAGEGIIVMRLSERELETCDPAALVREKRSGFSPGTNSV